MNWKLYSEALKFADENEEDPPDPGQSDGGGKDTEESDVDKLRASYDAKLAEYDKQLKALQAKLEQENTDSTWNAAFANAKREVDGFLEKLSAETDPQKAVEYAKGALQYIGPRYGQYAASSVKTDSMYKNAEAERFAFMLKAEVGGDSNSYKAQLLESKTIDEMRLKFERMQFDLGKEKLPKRNGSSDQPRMDRGRGSASRTDLQTKMADIDVSTPEGQKLWKEQRDGFKRQLEEVR